MNEISKQFIADLTALLKKYNNATIEAEDHFIGYAECGEDIRMTVSIDPVYKDGECIQDGAEIDLGRYLDGEQRDE